MRHPYQAVALAGLIGVFLVLGADRRTLHDKIAGTAVVRLSAPI